MVALIAALSLLLGQDKGMMIGAKKIVRPGGTQADILIEWNQDPLDPSAKSPKRFGIDKVQWEFPWVMRGFGNFSIPEKISYDLRFRVYSQERKAVADRAPLVTQMLVTLWDEYRKRCNRDHADLYNGGIVDVYLCWGGKPGGEQRFDIATEANTVKKVNTIYFYDLSSFTNPVEMAREVAHEYGHAALPAIGGYIEPESWANGFLGEKLFMRWLDEGMATGRYSSDDAMGCNKEDLDKWVADNVDPLVNQASQVLPTTDWMKHFTAVGMDRYIGLALFAETVLPDSVFGRSMLLTGSTDPWDYPTGLVLACEEPEKYELHIPKLLADKPIWVPTGRGKLSGSGLKILKYQGKWVKIQAREGAIQVINSN